MTAKWIERRIARLSQALAALLCAASAVAQPPANPMPLTWDQIRERLRAANPTLQAAQLNIEESKAGEVTAYLRPNPFFTATLDQVNPFKSIPSPVSGESVYRPLANVLPFGSVSYLHEREHKRELRLEVARNTTAVTASAREDQERNLLFTLRTAFVQTLHSRAVLDNARENLAYWDREIEVSRTRVNAGDIAAVDLDRLVLQRVQFESDLESAVVGLRTAKIQMLALLNDRTPVDAFDVSGPFDFTENLMSLDEFRSAALAARPDLREAAQSIVVAKSSHQLAIANGSTDPTFGLDFARNPPIPVYLGFNVTIPLRIFDHNQGEKARTLLDVTRNQRLEASVRAGVFNDVDSAWAALNGTANLLRPYRDQYLKLAEDVRDRVSFSWQNGGASLLDYLDSEKSLRDTRLAYLNLINAWLSAAAQMNQAVGREVI